MSGIKGTRDLIESRLLAEANNLKSIERVCSLIVDDTAIKQSNAQKTSFMGYLLLRQTIQWENGQC
jgi:hypothetical protein